ncbi:F-box/kelch-repeat protein At3g06240-like [Bidens hawaiensis]|uniref:F-box/kelch-repeat protein At3g06240-like n=1 Tax=Bidens hawaiensis TaxID=980011 RepID=UPI00404A9A2F
MASRSRNIPTEIITEILYRLPAKSLGRFRCVSKGFNSLLLQPGFIKTHQTTLNRKHFILEYDNDKSLYTLPFNYLEEVVLTPNELSFTFKPHVDMFTYLGSCNGLVLVSGHDVDGGHRLVVLNPTTNVFLEVPESGFDIVDELREIDIVYGFGYDSVSDDYKVVTVSFYNNDEEVNDVENIFVHVYSLKTDTWRRVCRFRYDHSYGKSYSGVFVNGNLHWIAIKDSDEDLRVIVAFSLADERLSEVALPKACNDADVGVKNGLKLVFGEKLAVFVEGDVWLMMEYGVAESWTKVVLGGIDASLMVRLEVFYENGKFLVVADGQMVVCGIEEGRLCLYDRVNTSKFSVRGICVESLVSPKFNKSSSASIET